MTSRHLETCDGMRVAFDVAIAMDDDVVLRADVFVPIAEGRYPVIMTYGPYAKGISFQESRPFAWQRLIKEHPEVAVGSTTKYQNWEVVDPEKWVPDGYVVVRVDARGTGRSPGYVDPWSPRETKNFYDCIEWAAAQEWSNGKVGLNGISYFAMNAWQVAALAPPHLVAICGWEGAADHYRDACFHGGIFSEFLSNWFPRAVVPTQNGVGERGPRSNITSEPVAGPETLSLEQLAQNRRDVIVSALDHALDDDYHRERSPELEKIAVPLLSAANWGGQGIHPRGNFETFMRASSKQKWLEAHGGTHWTQFYSDYGISLQKRFFGHFLKGEDTGWDKQPVVQLLIRHPGEKFIERHENEWPIARTQWTKFYLDSHDQGLKAAPGTGGSDIEYDALGDGATFTTWPLDKQVEITGPLAAKLFVSSSTADADIFVVLRVFAPDGDEVVFQGAQDPHTPIGQGWLRASHRKLDPKRSLPYRPYHTHDEAQPLTPGMPVELDIESGRPPSSCRRAIRSLSQFAERTMNTEALPLLPRTFLIHCVELGRLSMSILATAPPQHSAARTSCISARSSSHISCCRSFRSNRTAFDSDRGAKRECPVRQAITNGNWKARRIRPRGSRRIRNLSS
jgi:predicted acyl esterase